MAKTAKAKTKPAKSAAKAKAKPAAKVKARAKAKAKPAAKVKAKTMATSKAAKPAKAKAKAKPAAKAKVKARAVKPAGGSKARAPRQPSLATRPLTADDLDAVIALDTVIAGRNRRGYFKKRLAAALRNPAGHIQCAVTADGKLVGYVLAHVIEEVFGRAGTAADFESIGVARQWQGKGAGRLLLDALYEVMRHKGIGELQTQARWTDHRLLAFLDAAGFQLAPRLVISRNLADH